MVHLSGACKRKKRADEQKLLAKVPKLSSFFLSPRTAAATTPSVSVNPTPPDDMCAATSGTDFSINSSGGLRTDDASTLRTGAQHSQGKESHSVLFYFFDPKI